MRILAWASLMKLWLTVTKLWRYCPIATQHTQIKQSHYTNGTLQRAMKECDRSIEFSSVETYLIKASFNRKHKIWETLLCAENF